MRLSAKRLKCHCSQRQHLNSVSSERLFHELFIWSGIMSNIFIENMLAKPQRESSVGNTKIVWNAYKKIRSIFI